VLALQQALMLEPQPDLRQILSQERPTSLRELALQPVWELAQVQNLALRSLRGLALPLLVQQVLAQQVLT
jgi:hypothetical protein